MFFFLHRNIIEKVVNKYIQVILTNSITDMPRNFADEDSSSSHDGDQFLQDNQTNNNRCKFGSSCGIKTVNELHDKFISGNKKTAEAKARTRDGRAWAGARAADHDNGAFSAEASAGATARKDGNAELLKATASADAQIGLGGAIAEAGADATYLSHSDDKASLDVLKSNVGGGVGIGAGGAKAKLEAGVDLVSTKAKLGDRQSVNANLGLNANTGGEIGVDGVSATVLGVGASIGRNTGIHTPFGSINFKL